MIENKSDVFQIVVAISTVLFAFKLYYNFKFKYWSKHGVKTPPATFCLGHGIELGSAKRLQYECEWPRKYGKVYGLYIGTSPRLVVADANVLRTICIKDFHKFQNRFFSDPDFFDSYQKNFMSIKKDDEWKRTRAIITPTFTSGKMKRMFPLMEDCCQDLEQLFTSQNGQVVDSKFLFSSYTMNIITSCFFGLGMKEKSSAGAQPLLDTARKLVAPVIWRFFAMLTVPKFILKSVNFKSGDPHLMKQMSKYSHCIVEARRKQPDASRKYNDYLQLLLDAELGTDKSDSQGTIDSEDHHVGESDENRDQIRQETKKILSDVSKNQGKTKLSDVEIVANTMFFIFVGFESASTLMAHIVFALSFHPEIQENLYQEIQRVKRMGDGVLLYDHVTTSNYLDSVVCESLRIMSPLISMDRIASTDYKLEDSGITIPKGTIVLLAFYAIQQDPDYWPEPSKFDPSRFAPENRDKIVPGSYCPFGIGPRHCVAMRFALTETKLAIARLVDKVKFVPAPGCKFPPTAVRSTFLSKYDDIRVKVLSRADVT